MAGIGPQLPPHLQKKRTTSPDIDNDKKNGITDGDFYGPSLPPGFSTAPTKVIGPSIPFHLLESKKEDELTSEDEDVIGPSLLSQQEEDIDNKELIKQEIERRAETMKNRLTGKTEEIVERESWMLELPPELSKNFGLGPRTFRANAVELGDRSEWTETPASRELKRKEREEAAKSGANKKKKPIEIREPSKEELELQAHISEYNKQNRPQSLLDMHRSKQKSCDEPKVRRPFDRENDLTLTRSNPKEKAKFIETAKSFGDKFSGGSFEKKFL